MLVKCLVGERLKYIKLNAILWPFLGADLTFLRFFWSHWYQISVGPDTHRERKTFYKPKTRGILPSHLKEKDSDHNLKTPWVVDLQLLILGQAPHNQEYSITGWPMPPTAVAFKFFFAIGNNTSKCGPVHTGYRYLTETLFQETMFNLVICNALFSIPLFKYAGLELLNIFHGPLLG